MKKFIISALVSASMIATPAAALDRNHRNDSGQKVLVAGAAGLILGIAIAGDSKTRKRDKILRERARDNRRNGFSNHRIRGLNRTVSTVCDEYRQPVAYSNHFWNNGVRYTKIEIKCE